MDIQTGKVTGIGKIKIYRSDAFPYTIPTLSFIVAEKDGMYTASCLQLLLDSSDTSERSACDNLVNLCKEYLEKIFSDKNTAWDQLKEVFSSDIASDEWIAYRKVQIILAEKGIDTSSEVQNYLNEKITQLQEELKTLKNSKDEITCDIVDYQSIKKVA